LQNKMSLQPVQSSVLPSKIALEEFSLTHATSDIGSKSKACKSRANKRKIVLEEHFMYLGPDDSRPDDQPPALIDMLIDFNDTRIKAMDDADVELMVLGEQGPHIIKSKTVGESVQRCRDVNDFIAARVAEKPGRFRAWARLPMGDPAAAATELERCMAMGKHVFVGAMIYGFDTTGMTSDELPRYFDTPEYIDIFWKKAEQLGVPIYLHPGTNIPSLKMPYMKKYDLLPSEAFEFEETTAEHIIMLILGGVFNQCPNLKIIAGHMGEIVTMLSARSDPYTREFYNVSVVDTLRRNFYVTTSGFFDTAALTHVLAVMGIDRVMFSVDHPHDSMAKAARWLDCEGTWALTDEDYRKIALSNAQRLLGL